jgi:hypothetical protein
MDISPRTLLTSSRELDWRAFWKAWKRGEESGEDDVQQIRIWIEARDTRRGRVETRRGNKESRDRRTYLGESTKHIPPHL